MDTYGYSNYSSIDTTAVGALVGGLVIFIAIIAIIAITFVVLNIIGQWKAFKKAGKGGWEAIIPFYNTVTLCQITGLNPWWVLIVFGGSIVLSFIPVVGSLLSMALAIYFSVLLCVSTARSFGKSDSFAVGLYFLQPIFFMILGGKNTEYVGPKPMNDVVMNFVKDKTGNNSNQNNANSQNQVSSDNQNQAGTKFCTACGKKLNESDRFCTGCGKEVQ